MKRVIAADPYFFNERGHHHSYHSAVQQSFRGLGYHVETIIPFVCQVPELDGAEWIRFFHHSHWRYLRSFLHFFDYVRLFKRMRRESFEKTIFFLESYSLLDLSGLLFVVLLMKNKQLEFWQVIRNGLEESSRKKAVYVWIAKGFLFLLKNRYRLLSDSEVIVQSFQACLKCSVSLLPIPHTPSGVQAIHVSRHKKIRLWAAGEPRLDKGILELKKFCSMQNSNLSNMELWLESSRFFERSHRVNLDIHWVSSRLSREEYLRTLMSVDALLSPYDPVLFASRTSGPFVEAICAGKLVFVRDGSWLARELRRFGLVECVLNWDDPLSPSFLTQAFYSEETQKKRYHMQQAYLDFHNIESFRTCLGKLTE